MKNTLTICLVLLCCAVQLSAQGWERKYNRLSEDDFNEATFPLPGGYFGIRRLYVTSAGWRLGAFRTDIDGNQLWAKIIPGSTQPTEGVSQVIQTADGNFLLAGFNRSSTFVIRSFLTKVNNNGDTLWRRDFKLPIGNLEITGVVEMPDHTLRVVQTIDSTGNQGYYQGKHQIIALDSIGQILWSKNLLNVLTGWTKTAGLALSADNFLYASVITNNGSTGSFLTKMDESAEVVWTREVAGPCLDCLSKPFAMPDGGAGYWINGYVNSADTVNYSCATLSADGDKQWETEVLRFGATSRSIGRQYSQGADGSLLLAVGELDATPNGSTLDFRCIARVRPDSTIGFVHYKDFTDRIYTMGRMHSTPDGGYILGGSVQFVQYVEEPILIKLDSLGNIYSNKITGTIRKDANLNCSNENSETVLRRVLMRLTKPGADTVYATTTTNGVYTFEADTGTYTVSVLPPSTYWIACDTSVEVSFSGFYQPTKTANFPLQAVVDCALPEIDICTPNLRRCFESMYFVRYTNSGTIASDSLDIQVILDPYLTYVSAEIPPTSVVGDTLNFSVAGLAISAFEDFWIKVVVDCDSTVLGQTHCTSAYIYPDTFCLQSNGWSGADIEVSAVCLGDTTVQLTLTNQGPVPTTSEIEFVVIEDDVILRQEMEIINPSQSLVYEYPANGSFFRIESGQEPNHPIAGMPSAGIEGCGGFVSLGYPTLYSQYDSSPFTDIDCTENTDSYDPNDKQGFPKGVHEEHFIHANEDIEYIVRFQNEGTANAVVVTVRDTLPSTLDLSTFRMGAASHPFTWEVAGPGILKVRFANINLPPKSLNEPASHGFFSFRISQKKDLVPGTQILNSAAIYFDFNAPVITNQTLHTIGEKFLEISPTHHLPQQVRATVKIVPNPVAETALIQLEGAENQSYQMVLYNALGTVLWQKDFEQNSIQFAKGSLPSGVYLFKIKGKNGVAGSGKLILK